MIVFIFVGFKILGQKTTVQTDSLKITHGEITFYSFKGFNTLLYNVQKNSSVNESNKRVGLINLTKKSETKKLLQSLITIYGDDLNKITHKKIQDCTLADSTCESVHFENQKFSFMFKIALSNSMTKLTFSNPKLNSRVNAYQGQSKNLKKLFTKLDMDVSDHIPDSISNNYLKNPIYINLYNNSSFIKRYYNRMWRQYRRPDRLTLGFFGGVNFSTAFVSPFRYSDETELKTKTRRENEEYLPTGIFGFSAGYSRYSHGVDFFYQHTNYGCKYVEGNQINWNTGFYGGSSAASDSMKLSFPVNQFGIRYRYSNYYKIISTYASVGMHLSYVNKDSRNLLQLNSRYLSTGCNLALGLNIHPIYALDIHIAPVMNISFNAVKKTELQTRFSSIALEVGLNYNLTFINKRYRTN